MRITDIILSMYVECLVCSSLQSQFVPRTCFRIDGSKVFSAKQPNTASGISFDRGTTL